MKTLIVIPARIGSTRFPAKPLHQIAGHSLVSRVADVAARVAAERKDTDYVIATDDSAIMDHAREIGAPAVMTDPDLPSGTDRALAAALALDTAPDFVLNLQGDAPFTPPAYLGALIDAAATTEADVVTPVVQLDWAALDTVREQKTREPFSGTSCIRRADGMAIWFSKQVIPAIRKEERLREKETLSPVWRHIGLYGFRMAALERFAALPVGHYEALEGLEQLRFLENGMSIFTVAVEPGANAMWGIDTPEDAAFAEKLIAEQGDPMEAPPLMARTLYIVRHGNTFDKGDTVTRVGARTDLPLSSSGQAQAEALAAHFRPIAFAQAIAGPLERTRQTAEAILAEQAAPPELEIGNFLREIDYGPDENQPEEAVIARIGQPALDAWERDAVPPPGWRFDPAAIEGQWQSLFAKLARSEETGPVLIVTSNGIARFALTAAGLAPDPARHETLKLKTGAYGMFQLAGDGSVTLDDWNVRV